MTGGSEFPLAEDGRSFICHVDDLEGVKAVDLRSALQSYVEWFWGDPSEGETALLVADVPKEYFDDESPTENVSFHLEADQLYIGVGFTSYEYLDKDVEPDAVNRFEQALTPYLTRKRCILADWQLDQYYTNPCVIDIKVLPSLRGRTLMDLFDLGKDITSLLDAMQRGSLTRQTTLDLLRGGRAEVLIGQPEGPWLDVKSAHYDLSMPSGKISLAQAVARFANAEHGGIVVVGMKGKKVPGGEEIRQICPVPFESGIERKYQTALEQHLYPPPDYLDIETVKINSGMLVLIHIPPQPEELKPFLVHGAIVEGGVEGAFISIVRRRGESSIPTTAAAIHATLAAGRALLRRGQLPDHSS
ncbi:ATP-binding protein [Streptomyces leeuwenhoekii]|uniref:ATP-binding protein n=1 Tax=Streptomyces leeuwenhoekii TaxID=1437453 RepID=UPI001A9258B7|nr:ATP-binding protein [Streptomyces leeuwenhoekii]